MGGGGAEQPVVKGVLAVAKVNPLNSEVLDEDERTVGVLPKTHKEVTLLTPSAHVYCMRSCVNHLPC